MAWARGHRRPDARPRSTVRLEILGPGADARPDDLAQEVGVGPAGRVECWSSTVAAERVVRVKEASPEKMYRVDRARRGRRGQRLMRP